MKNLAITCSRTIGIMIIACALSGIINNKMPMMYALLIGSVYMLACAIASVKIGALEKMSETARNAIYLSAYFVLDVIFAPLSLLLIGPSFGYFLAFLLILVLFVGKLMFFAKNRYTEVKSK